MNSTTAESHEAKLARRRQIERSRRYACQHAWPIGSRKVMQRGQAAGRAHANSQQRNDRAISPRHKVRNLRMVFHTRGIAVARRIACRPLSLMARNAAWLLDAASTSSLSTRRRRSRPGKFTMVLPVSFRLRRRESLRSATRTSPVYGRKATACVPPTFERKALHPARGA